MRLFIFLATVTFACLFTAGYCQAVQLSGPVSPSPFSVFSTISAESPEQGQAAVSISGEKSGKPDYYRFSTQISLGITDNIEFGINIPYFDNTYSGLEDIAASLKHRIIEEGDMGPSLAYLLTGSVQSSTEDTSTDGRLGAGVVCTKRVGPVRGHANLIYAVPGDSTLEDEVRFSAGFEFSAANNFDILAEVFGRKSHFSTSADELEARFGYRILYGKGVFSTIGAGLGLDGKESDYRLIASITISFPRRETAIEKIYEED
jgi:hypothetical protein